MKITRHSIKENSKITAMWLYEFAHDLEKNAQNIDYLKDYLNKVHRDKSFNTIEEKMADIRERIGFDLTKQVVNEIEKISQEKSASYSCGCDSSSETCSCSVKTAKKHLPRDVELMGNILKYIKDMVQHEPHLDSATVLSRCKNEEGLRYCDLEKKIDREKLVNYTNDLLKHFSNDTKSDLVAYTPLDSDKDIGSESEDTVADYYSHADTSLS